MNTEELYNSLTDAYSDTNLNKITGKLILLFKSRDFTRLRQIAASISDFVAIEEKQDSRFFSRLIMLYHPDKGESLRKSIKNYYSDNDRENLLKLSHIFKLNDIDKIVIEFADDDLGFEPEYMYDVDLNNGFHIFDEEDEPDDFIEEEGPAQTYEKSFYNEIKMREYGTVNIEFPPYYLEDYSEFEMVDCGLETLEGVEFCKQAVWFDFSNNSLTDISNLRNLKNIKELYLANNNISLIEDLAGLENLRIIDLSGNQIDDISPLLDLPNLEYVNLAGNIIPVDQIARLSDKQVVVII